uniref:Uncharacterized protein n=1 Tax=Oryza rufipogon TaxID=4529 RepID=A0A0E0PN90_ORYRU
MKRLDGCDDQDGPLAPTSSPAATAAAVRTVAGRRAAASLSPQRLLLLLICPPTPSSSICPPSAAVVALLVRQGREGAAVGRLDAFATISATSSSSTPLARAGARAKDWREGEEEEGGGE